MTRRVPSRKYALRLFSQEVNQGLKRLEETVIDRSRFWAGAIGFGYGAVVQAMM